MRLPWFRGFLFGRREKEGFYFFFCETLIQGTMRQIILRFVRVRIASGQDELRCLPNLKNHEIFEQLSSIFLKLTLEFFKVLFLWSSRSENLDEKFLFPIHDCRMTASLSATVFYSILDNEQLKIYFHVFVKNHYGSRLSTQWCASCRLSVGSYWNISYQTPYTSIPLDQDVPLLSTHMDNI